MRTPFNRILSTVVLAAAFSSSAHAGMVRFNAVIDSSQETTGSDSNAIGAAVVNYDVDHNTFDLVVIINGFTNTLNNSHIHEAPLAMDGDVVTTLGPEGNYTRSGNTITGTFLDVEYGGDPATLLAGGAYLNFHTTTWPGGEVRGQLIADPVRLSAIVAPQQETGAVESTAFGAALGEYDPATGTLDLKVFVYDFANMLINSHIHEAPAGVDGDVVNILGGAEDYDRIGNTYTHAFEEIEYAGDPLELLSGRAYLNFHSDVYAGGEVRGQLRISQEREAARLVNVSARGFIGTGENVLITGFVIHGTEPLAVLVTGRGPFLTQFGVANAVADPVATVYNSAGRELLRNDNFLEGPYAAEVLGLSFGLDLAEPAEAAQILILPPGVYTSIVSGSGGATGVGLAEAYEAEW